MNILLLGGAKRVAMARMIKEAAKARGEGAEIYSYEMSAHVPVTVVGKAIVGLRWSDPGIYDDLLRVVDKYGISIIVPFVDGAVAVAAEMHRRYPDRVFAPTCTSAQAEAMFDKVQAAKAFAAAHLPIPATYAEGASPQGLIAKPRYGSASKGIVAIDTEAQLRQVRASAAEYLIQERIDHREEYTVDCYVSVRTGTLLTVVPRKRIEVSGGEVVHTETVFRPEVFDLAKEALARLSLRGAVTIQIIRDLDTDRYMLMEINPRLGGGAVCAVYAGANLPALILADANGETPDFACYRPNTEVVRYLQDVCFFN